MLKYVLSRKTASFAVRNGPDRLAKWAVSQADSARFILLCGTAVHTGVARCADTAVPMLVPYGMGMGTVGYVVS